MVGRPNAGDGQQQGARQVQTGGAQCQRIALLHQHGDHFGAEAGEGSEAAQQTRDKRKAPNGVQLRQGLEDGNADADQVGTYQVGRQRTPGNGSTGTKPKAQAPASQGASAGADTNCDYRQHHFSSQVLAVGFFLQV